MEERKKFEKVLEDKEFAERIVKMETPEEVQKAFAEKGVEISKEEVQVLGSIINKVCEKKSAVLSQEDLNEIAGGNGSDDDDTVEPQSFTNSQSPTLTPTSSTELQAPNLILQSSPHDNSTGGFLNNLSTYQKAGLGIGGGLLAVAAIAGTYKGVKWAYNKYKGRK